MPQSLGLSRYAQEKRMNPRTAVRWFEEGRLPSYVGQVQAGPISISEWARRNGVSMQKTFKLFHAGKLPQGVVSGGRRRKAPEAFWDSPAGKEAIWTELLNVRKTIEGVNSQQRALLTAARRVEYQFGVVKSLRHKIARHGRTLRSLSRINNRHTHEFTKLAVALRMSELVLRPDEVMTFDKALRPALL
jgi:hypothetical protein